MPGELPAHASPALAPKHDQSYFPKDHEPPSHIALDQDTQTATAHSSSSRTAASRAALAAVDIDSHHHHRDPTATPPPALLSPAFTPPATPGTGTPAGERDARSFTVDSDARAELAAPRLLPQLPKVECVVRARIPTTITGVEMFLHLYHNDIDNKEHLAIVFGDKIRSRSLDAVKPGETEMDRMIRGAYVGRLHPGRTSSRLDSTNGSSGKASPMLQALQKPGGKSAAASARAGANLGETISQMLPAALTSPLKSDEEKAQEQMRKDSPLVRIHSECYTGETVWSARCDCGEQLDEAARLMSLPSASSAGGVIVYLRQEGRGIGLSEKLKAYNLQDLGSDTVEANLLLRHPADARSYGLATAILCDLGLGGEKGIRLLTNNPDKIRAVEGPNEEVVVKERVAMVPLSWTTGGAQGFNSPEVGQYLRTKIERMGHLLNMNG